MFNKGRCLDQCIGKILQIFSYVSNLGKVVSGMLGGGVKDGRASALLLIT